MTNGNCGSCFNDNPHLNNFFQSKCCINPCIKRLNIQALRCSPKNCEESCSCYCPDAPPGYKKACMDNWTGGNYKECCPGCSGGCPSGSSLQIVPFIQRCVTTFSPCCNVHCFSNIQISGLPGSSKVILQPCFLGPNKNPILSASPLGQISNPYCLYEYCANFTCFKFGPVHLGLDSWSNVCKIKVLIIPCGSNSCCTAPITLNISLGCPKDTTPPPSSCECDPPW